MELTIGCRPFARLRATAKVTVPQPTSSNGLLPAYHTSLLLLEGGLHGATRSCLGDEQPWVLCQAMPGPMKRGHWRHETRDKTKTQQRLCWAFGTPGTASVTTPTQLAWPDGHIAGKLSEPLLEKANSDPRGHGMQTLQRATARWRTMLVFVDCQHRWKARYE